MSFVCRERVCGGIVDALCQGRTLGLLCTRNAKTFYANVERFFAIYFERLVHCALGGLFFPAGFRPLVVFFLFLSHACEVKNPTTREERGSSFSAGWK